ncbi:MAG TPA: M1 family metallopeptidase [Marmoricola sp.]|nr:M1 family metallopeptidase [Marmoricola sp.]
MSHPQETAGVRRFPDDPHSYSRPGRVAVRHLELDLDVDFDARRLSGSVRLDLDRHTAGATDLVLDTWQIEVLAVTDADGAPLGHDVGQHDPILGCPLTIAIGSADSVVVRYRTHPDARAVQWLDPAQTSSGQPFLFTQSEAILARSWVPLQDTPSVRFSYDATVRVPPHLLALMSAENPVERNDTGTYRFSMPQPVPSYLMALAVGDVEFRTLGPRSGVYAEPSVVERAAWEFADTERMMAAVERLFGPYRWDRYDLLVAPPSFPFGGMENPRLTFVTPTVIAGDRSLVSLVAHELAHSWSGNLVTNASWKDVWLNEGFTVYLETRIDEEVYGEEFAAMIRHLYRQDLDGSVQSLEPRDTWLEQDVAGRDPDEGITDIPYDKGALFLTMLEHAVGRSRFDTFLTAYFDRFAFQPMDTATFLQHLRSELLEPSGLSAEDLAVEAWVHGPGVPDNAPEWRSERFAAVDREVEALLGGKAPVDLDTSEWTPHEWVHLIRALPRDAGTSIPAALDAAFGLTTSRNDEILAAWLPCAVETGLVFEDPRVDAAVAAFLRRQGRSKFLRPVYRALVATDRGNTRAREIYAEVRPGYHPVARGVVDRILADT